MFSDNIHGNGAARARVIVALRAVLAMALGAMASPAAAAPFAYVANGGANTVSVIATAINKVVGIPIPVGTNPVEVAVTPEGKHAYVIRALLKTGRGNRIWNF